MYKIFDIKKRKYSLQKKMSQKNMRLFLVYNDIM